MRNILVKGISIVVGALGDSLQRLGKENRGTGDLDEELDDPDHSAVKIGLMTLKNPGDLKKLAVTS